MQEIIAQLGSLFPPSQVAEIIREPGEDTRVVATQHSTFLQRQLVRVRATEGDGRTATQLCTPGDIAVSKILRVLTSLGISDNRFMEVASILMAACSQDEDATGRSDNRRKEAAQPLVRLPHLDGRRDSAVLQGASQGHARALQWIFCFTPRNGAQTSSAWDGSTCGATSSPSPAENRHRGVDPGHWPLCRRSGNRRAR